MSQATDHHPAQTAFIGLGSNLSSDWGTPLQTLQQAVDALQHIPQTQLQAISPVYISAPVDSDGDDYTNAVLQLKTQLDPLSLLHQLQRVEQLAGRQRPYHNAPRTLDLDLLLYAHVRMDSPTLTLPHPRMASRAFVLRPLADIAPQWVSAQALSQVAGQTLQSLGNLLHL